MPRSAFDTEDDPFTDQWQPESSVASIGDIGNNGAPIIDDEPLGTANIGEPTMISPSAAEAPSTTTIPEVAAPVPVMPPASDIRPPDSPTDEAARVARMDEAFPGAPAQAPAPPAAPAMEPVSFAPSTVETDAIPKPDMPKDARLKVTQTVQSPEQNAVNADAAKLADAKAAAERNASAQRTRDLQEQEKVAAQQAAQQLEKKRQTELILKDHNDRLAAATARNEKALDDYKGMKIHDFWSDKSVGDRVIAALAVFLGGLGTAFGGENTAMKNLNSIIQRDYDRQKDEIAQKFAVYGETSKNLERAQLLKEHAINDLNLRFAAATEATAAQLAQMKLKQAIPAEQVQRDKNVLEIYEKANVFKQQSAKDTNAMVEWDTYNKAKTGGGRATSSPAETEYLKLFEGGATPAQLNAFAVANNIDNKAQDKLVARGEKLLAGDRAEKAAAAKGGGAGAAKIGEVHGPGGVVIGNIATGDLSLDRKRAEEVAKANSVYTDLRATLVELEKSRATEGKHLPSIKGFALSDVAGKREALHSHALTQLKEMAKLGVLAGPDMALMEQQLGSGIANSSGVGGSKLGDITKIVDRGHEKFLDSVGLNGKTALPMLRGEGAPSAPKAAPPAAGPKAETDDITRARIRQAAEAIKPNSGATPAQRKRAQEILNGLGAR